MSIAIYLAMLFGGALGVTFHVLAQVQKLRKKFPKHKAKEILGIFFDEEWNVLFVSAAVNTTCIIAEKFGASTYLGVPVDSKELTLFVSMLVIGYAGQRLVYKWLGSTEKVLTQQIDKD